MPAVGASRADVFAADVVLQVRVGDFGGMREGQVVIGMADPLGSPETAREIASRGVTAFALELIPRITRAQSMDVLSSMATIAGYKAVLLAAGTLPRMFPLLTTAAGTITPAHVFIVGVGVAGLQAIATARKLGAVVEAYDVRPAVKEQVQSVGAKFVELPLETGQAEDKGGYAKAQDESFYQRQREMMARVVAANDVVITTAVVPGKKAPVLVTADMVRGMAPGSVIVDLAAERGGNCELTRPDEVVVEQRRHDSGAHESAFNRAVSRQPDVREKHHDVSAAPCERRDGEARYERRNHARYADCAGRRGGESEGESCVRVA